MAVKIRLKRMGRRGRPSYRIAVIDSQSRRDGRTVETIGHYDPLVTDPERMTAVNEDRANYWLRVGAQPSKTVLSILRKHDVALPIKAKRSQRKRKRK